MQWLNYHHLLYFWSVAREGGVSRACAKLHVAQPTVSAQLRQLEKALGVKLFERQGRNLALTETGRLALRYADEIFALGQELQEVLAGGPRERLLPIKVGVPDALPKLITYHILKPLFESPDDVQLHCREGTLDDLYTQMAGHEIDLVISDSPATPGIRVRAFSHLLGESPVSVFGAAPLAAKFGRRFPESLADAPWLLPTGRTLLRRSLDQWFDARGWQPRVAAEIEDSALLMTFGEVGRGLFVASTAIEAEVSRQYRVRVVGRLADVTERFYAITPERRIKHPAAAAITAAARRGLFVARRET